MPRKVSLRRPRLTVGPRGVHITKPSLRLGSRKAGLNISSRGLSYSFRTPLGTINTRKGCSRTLVFLLIPALAALITRLHI